MILLIATGVFNCLFLCIWWFQLLTTLTFDEPAPGLKVIVQAKLPDHKSGKVYNFTGIFSFCPGFLTVWYVGDNSYVFFSEQAEVQYFHDYAAISTSVGFTASPIVNFSGVVGTNVLALGTDVAFNTESGNFKHFNAGLNFTKDDLIASLIL